MPFHAKTRHVRFDIVLIIKRIKQEKGNPERLPFYYIYRYSLLANRKNYQ